MATKIRYKLNSDMEQRAFNVLYELKDRSEVNARAKNGSDETLYEGLEVGGVKKIVYDEIEYSCGGDKRSQNTLDVAQSPLTDTGFSWFRAIRGEAEDAKTKGAKKWNLLLTEVPQNFFKRYPILIYDKKDEKVENDEKFQRNLMNLMKAAFDLEEQNIKFERVKTTRRTFYGASLRLELSTGGMPFPVVGRIIFAQNEDRGATKEPTFSVLKKEQAESFTKDIVFSEDGQTADFGSDPTGEISGFQKNGLKEFLQGFDLQQNLHDYLVFSDEDKRILAERTKDPNVLVNGVITFSCEKIEVKLCMKISVNVPQYNIHLKCGTGEKILTATSFSNLITLKCDCGTKLLEDNKLCTDEALVSIKFDDKDDTVNFVSIGKSGDEAKALAKEKVFSKHLYHIECDLMYNNGKCDAYVCNRNYVEVLQANGKTAPKCADCPYCETYMNMDDFYYDVDMLRFDGKELFVKGKTEKRCRICGRFIQKGNECSLCNDLLHGKFADHRRLYRKYKILLPLTTRLKHFGVKHKCAEDQEYIVFMLQGKKRKDRYEVYDKIKEDWVDLRKIKEEAAKKEAVDDLMDF